MHLPRDFRYNGALVPQSVRDFPRGDEIQFKQMPLLSDKISRSVTQSVGPRIDPYELGVGQERKAA